MFKTKNHVLTPLERPIFQSGNHLASCVVKNYYFIMNGVRSKCATTGLMIVGFLACA